MRIIRLLSLLIATAIAAQTTSSLIVVVENHGSPLPGVKVTVAGTGGAPTTAITGADGIARFAIPPGRYQVTAEFQGSPSEKTTVLVDAGEKRVTLQLGPNPRAAWGESGSASFPSTARPPSAIAPQPQPAAPTLHRVIEMPAAAIIGPRASMPRAIDVNQGENYAVVSVHYATDRQYSGELAPAKRFGAERGPLRLGVARVSVPRDHEMGDLETPSIFRLEFRNDPKKDVVLLSVDPQRDTDFYSNLKNGVQASKRHETFVFIHGFNVTFEDAARRTAQIKYDLGFDGPAILYSWPSWGKTESYPADKENAEWSSTDLRIFLSDLAARTGATSIHLVAHSMGNRVLGRALAGLMTNGQNAHFDQVVLAAPDIDCDVFKRDIAPAFMRFAKHITLYASSKDEALKAGKKFDNSKRLGDTDSEVVVMPPMDTIDVSDVDTTLLGHSYVAQNRTVLSDVYCLIHGATEAKQRCRLAAVGGYWKFVGKMETLTSLANYRCSAATCMIHQ